MKLGWLMRLCGGCGAAALLAGCAEVAPLAGGLSSGLGGSSSFEAHTQTQVKLVEGNFITIRTNVVGSSKGFKLLGFITLYPATVDKAMDRMYTRAEAHEGRPETFAHLVVEHSGIYVILFSIPKVTVRADLIEFLPAHFEDEDDSSRSMEVHPVLLTSPKPRH